MVRWIHKVWNAFWAIVATLVIVVVFGTAALFMFIQTETSKTFIANRIEQNFSQKYNGVFTIGKLDGLIPFQIELEEVNLYPDSSSINPVFQSDSISANLNVLALLRNRFIVTGLNIESPEIVIDPDSKTSLLYALKKKNQSIDSKNSEAPFFEIVAPSVTLNSGELLVRNAFQRVDSTNFRDSVLISDINLSMFFEYRQDERYVDLENLTFETENFDLGRTIIYGQIYSDNQFLEFNSFNFINEQSYANFTGRIEGINIFNTNFAEQLRAADYNLLIQDLSVSKERLNTVLTSVPELQHDIFLNADFTGDLDEITMNDTQLRYGNSSIQASGILQNLRDFEKFRYDLEFSETTLDTSDVKYFAQQINDYQLEAISEAVLEAKVEGDLGLTSGNFSSKSSRGTILIDGLANWNTNSLDISFETDSLNIGNLIGGFVESTNITSEGLFKTQNYEDISSFELAEFNSKNFQINDTSFSLVKFEASGSDKIIYPEFTVEANGGEINGSGVLDLSGEIKSVDISGSGSDLNLKYISQVEELANVIADINYDLNFEGSSWEDIAGVLDLEIPFAISGDDTLKPHLVYADVANIGEGNKSVRITTTAGDISLEGEYDLNDLASAYNHWKDYFVVRTQKEFFFQDTNLVLRSTPGEGNFRNQDLKINAQLKDVGLVQSYFPDFPTIVASTRINSSITVDQNRLLFNADIFDPDFVFEEYEGDSVRTQLTGSFRYNEPLKEFSEFLITANIQRLNTPYFATRGFDMDFTMNMDSLNLTTNIQQIGEDAFLKLNSEGTLTDSSFAFDFQEFELGSLAYSWTNRGIPSISYTDKKEVVFNNFTFENQEELFNIEGAFSESTSDSVNYLFRGVRLDRISDLINGKIDFGGNLNGTFTTRTLTQVPTIEGNIDLRALSLNDQIVGDFEVSSNFNSELNRFDTKVSVKTDSTIYPEYFERNDRQGQNLTFSGYVLAPENGEFPKVDSLYHFDLDFNTIDLWIIPFLAPKVFTEMSGVASGSGEVWGNLETYDFRVDYDIGLDDAVYMKPRFLDTYYYGQGPVTFSRSEGLVFEDIFLIDPSGGMATLSGFYNFNDFQPVHSMNIRIDTDEFQFLNNDFDATAPFFGEAYGTGVVNISGSNLSPVLTTVEPMVISDFSTIELPLLEETDFNQDNKFIRFVDSFEEYESRLNQSADGSSAAIDQQVDASELTFAERFTLDLQFIANDPMTVRLIFDQVTGDVITADGTGRLRIRLEDQDLSIFGRFDISGGNYQFVSGDIFSRRFSIEPGGSIVWEGDPQNARLNINAVYSARPNIRTLTTARSELDLNDPNSIQRTPVDLVLNISGSISSIENNFFFRLPNTFESRQNSTLSTQIAALNRNEDEKLLQATSFLLMGDFIPASSVNGTSSLTENFSGSGAVLNPLLSNQVISPLLSNQINSLLSSDISSFDVDFNLNTYNQVDLGLALRLYNDRIIIRRDGQITGAQSNIGDLGATYRINRTFSVTAFHRQDPTFSNLSESQDSQQGQEINGVGVEAEVTFNTWQEFFNRLGSPFRKLFGINKEDENEDENPS